MTERPSLDEYFLEIAYVVGRERPASDNVGAVIGGINVFFQPVIMEPQAAWNTALM